MNTQQLARVMRMSWQVQKRRQYNRSKALISEWAIFLNEDSTVYHLIKKHSHERYTNKPDAQGLTLFNQ